MINEVGLIGGIYKLGTKIGKGAFGEVYAGTYYPLIQHRN